MAERTEAKGRYHPPDFFYIFHFIIISNHNDHNFHKLVYFLSMNLENILKYLLKLTTNLMSLIFLKRIKMKKSGGTCKNTIQEVIR